MIRESLENIINELQDWKLEGETSVAVDEETLNQLRALAPGEQHGRSGGFVNQQSPASSEAQRVEEASVTSDMRSAAHVDGPEERNAQPFNLVGATSAPDSSPSSANDSNKTHESTSPTPFPEPPQVDLPDGSKEAQYEALKEQVLNCPVCNSQVRPDKKVVIGSGKLSADLFFCGEAPGAEEEIQGEVFVGRAGELLNKMIGAMGLSREDVYVGNIMNWRPPVEVGNRPPTQEEMRFCLPYLRAQLEIVQPKVIVALGKTAVDGLLGHDPKRRMNQIRGVWHEFENKPLMITFHPSYLLRNNTLRTKRMAWEDMLAVMEKIELPISEKQRHYFLK